NLARFMARDGEGATKLIECNVKGADSFETAKKAAKSVIMSSLFKAAMFGEDANCGRIMCALGYADADYDVNKIDISIASRGGYLNVCKQGSLLDFDEVLAKKILVETDITIIIDLNQGDNGAMAYGCDLTYDYVKINGDYRS
ncbi:MAG: bifunctional ornithine acetyltransferase/N-acetylglutamate synthase, partial [Ruminiclostridium sp.]|nr:bifunctional ornithine acetyltransferase/N-acetylglutamate synthase [Ruminiclostridium sp.]